MSSDTQIQNFLGSPKTIASMFNRDVFKKMWPVILLASSRGIAVLGQFLAQIVVGVLAGASGLGILQLFTSWTCVVGEVSAMGLPTRVMRQVSVAYADKNIELIMNNFFFDCSFFDHSILNNGWKQYCLKDNRILVKRDKVKLKARSVFP